LLGQSLRGKHEGEYLLGTGAARPFAGLGAGLLNGLLVVKLGIPSLVATIGALFFWRGVVLIVTDGVGETTVHLRDGFVHTLLVGRLDVPVIGRVPGQMIWLIGLAVVLWFVLNRHRFGAHTYLVGDNAESARMMGVKTDRVRVMLFALMGVFAALAGIVATLEQNYFWPTVGEGALLPTVAIVFLGGTSIFGGTGTILGTVVADSPQDALGEPGGGVLLPHAGKDTIAPAMGRPDLAADARYATHRALSLRHSCRCRRSERSRYRW
jgi:ribose/xylose/arabinose/galactoside ABC-type transport system permease subunit